MARNSLICNCCDPGRPARFRVTRPLGRSRMGRFPKNDIISLIGEAPRYDLAESVGPDLRLRDALEDVPVSSFGDLTLDYGTAQGDPRLRELIADAHGARADD